MESLLMGSGSWLSSLFGGVTRLLSIGINMLVSARQESIFTGEILNLVDLIEVLKHFKYC
jgi:hypothetical protein